MIESTMANCSARSENGTDNYKIRPASNGNNNQTLNLFVSIGKTHWLNVFHIDLHGPMLDSRTLIQLASLSITTDI